MRKMPGRVRFDCETKEAGLLDCTKSVVHCTNPGEFQCHCRHILKNIVNANKIALSTDVNLYIYKPARL